MTTQTIPQTQEEIQIHINGQLVQLDNILTAISYLEEELKTRKLETQPVLDAVKEVIQGGTFYERFLNWFKRCQLPSISENVKTEIKNDINYHLENYILSKLDERIQVVIDRQWNHI